MNIRKAHALQLAITQQVGKIAIEIGVSISRFDSAQPKFYEARAKHAAALQKKFALIDALYEVRSLISVANESAGVPVLLARMAAVDKKITVVAPLAETKEFAPSMETLRAQHQDLVKEEQTPNSYVRRREEITVNLVRPEDGYVKLLADLRRQKQSLSDELLAANVKTEIVLPVALEKTLKAHDLV